MGVERGVLIAGMLALQMAAAVAAYGQSAPDVSRLPDVIDESTGQVFPLTPDQKSLLNAAVIQCEDTATSPEIADECAPPVIRDFIETIKMQRKQGPQPPQYGVG